MGYVTFIPVDEEPTDMAGQLSVDDKNYILENSYFKITMDPASGTIQSLTDKNSGKEMVAENSEWKFGQYVTERFSKNETDKYAHDYIKAGWHWAYAELGRINLTDEPYKRISIFRVFCHLAAK
ncbi:glycoside hydrolase family 38 C-terminal domain-containing protein [Gaoshiqia sp. Z1-71]|uniref:glycoside hydrolase family 38 C-terminal domain-containing protein n=1 Tax=Gaoshiqia hydrogeniformans TaxID=3290090 RepID=UPI003BF91DAB